MCFKKKAADPAPTVKEPTPTPTPTPVAPTTSNQTEVANLKAAQDRVDAEQAQQAEALNRAKTKREDISVAVSEQMKKSFGGVSRGGRGRRSLFRGTQGAMGFLGRFE